MHPENLLLTSLFLFIILTVSWRIRQTWLWSHAITQLENPKAKTPRLLKPKTGDDCPACRKQKSALCPETGKPVPLSPWSEVKSRRGSKKTIPTHGYTCNNRECEYFHNMDAAIHALVGYGRHGKQENIQDLICQACRKKFTVRRDTVLYRLKTYSEKVALMLGLLAEGMDISALERITNIGEGTLRTWLTRAGLQAEKLHGLFFHELLFTHIQLDELWANVRQASHEVWLWVATEATTKVIPVIQLGPRMLDMAMAVVRELVGTMRSGCTPVLTTDGLKLYFYALTAHFGQWLSSEDNKKPIWQVSADFIDG